MTPVLNRLLLGTPMIASLASAADAAGLSERAVTLVIPFAARRSTDVVDWIMAAKMSAHLVEQMIVPDMGGAGGCLGVDTVQELIDLADTEALAYASPGNGMPLHLSGNCSSRWREST